MDSTPDKAESVPPASSSPTQGSRLAQRLDAKAKTKRSLRGQQARYLEDQTLARVETWRSWLSANHRLAWIVAGGAALLIGGLVWGIVRWQERQTQTAERLVDLVEDIPSSALVTAEQGDELQEKDQDPKQKAKQLGAFARAHRGSDAARWAALAQGAALLRAGEFQGASEVYATLLPGSGDNELIAWRTLEGLGRAHEGLGQWSKAAERYKQLEKLAGGAYAPAALHALGRVQAADGRVDEAKKTWKKLRASLVGDPTATARTTLREVDRLLKFAAVAPDLLAAPKP